MRGLYRLLLGLYPARVRAEFAEEMLDVFESASADARRNGVFAYVRFCLREAAGLLLNLVGEGRTMKHKKLILQGGIAGLVIGIAFATAWASRPYTSTAVLRANPPQIPERFVPAQPTMEVGRVIPHLMQTITARGSLTNIMNSYDLYRSERESMPLEDVIDVMRNAIAVAPADMNTVRVSFSHDDPGVAQKVTTDIVNRIISEYIRERAQQATLTMQFMKDSAQDAAAEWETSLTAVREAEASGRSVARARLDADIARQRYETLSAKLAEAEMTTEMEQRQQGQTLELLDPPTLPSEWRPSVWMSAVGGFLGGALLCWIVSLVLSMRAAKPLAEVR
jgi:hypothetical protein